MSVEQASFDCPQCQTRRLFTAQTMNHTPHILASVFLCGLWLPMWFVIATTYTPRFHCSVCGYTNLQKYLANPRLQQQEREAAAAKREAAAISGNSNQTWMYAAIGAGAVVFLLTVVYLAISRNQNQQPAPAAAIINQTPTPQTNDTEKIAAIKNRTAGNNGHIFYDDYLILMRIQKTSVQYAEAQRLIKLFGEQNRKKK